MVLARRRASRDSSSGCVVRGLRPPLFKGAAFAVGGASRRAAQTVLCGGKPPRPRSRGLPPPRAPRPLPVSFGHGGNLLCWNFCDGSSCRLKGCFICAAGEACSALGGRGVV